MWLKNSIMTLNSDHSITRRPDRPLTPRPSADFRLMGELGFIPIFVLFAPASHCTVEEQRCLATHRGIPRNRAGVQSSNPKHGMHGMDTQTPHRSQGGPKAAAPGGE